MRLPKLGPVVRLPRNRFARALLFVPAVVWNGCIIIGLLLQRFWLHGQIGFVSLRMRLKLWLWIGGEVNRHPHHWAVWGSASASLGALATGLVFGAETSTLRVLGGLVYLATSYVILSFFFPLWLPPIRDEQRVALLRERLKKAEEKEV